MTGYRPPFDFEWNSKLGQVLRAAGNSAVKVTDAGRVALAILGWRQRHCDTYMSPYDVMVYMGEHFALTLEPFQSHLLKNLWHPVCTYAPRAF